MKRKRNVLSFSTRFGDASTPLQMWSGQSGSQTDTELSQLGVINKEFRIQCRLLSSINPTFIRSKRNYFSSHIVNASLCARNDLRLRNGDGCEARVRAAAARGPGLAG